MSQVVLRVFTWFLFGLGLVGVLVPLLPSLPLITLGVLVYGYFTGWTGLNLTFWLVALVLAFLSLLAEYSAGAAVIKRRGGSQAAARAATWGLILGPLVLGPLGIIIGPVLLATLAELAQGKDVRGALTAGLLALQGLALSSLLKLACLSALIIWFWHSVG